MSAAVYAAASSLSVNTARPGLSQSDSRDHRTKVIYSSSNQDSDWETGRTQQEEEREEGWVSLVEIFKSHSVKNGLSQQKQQS